MGARCLPVLTEVHIEGMERSWRRRIVQDLKIYTFVRDSRTIANCKVFARNGHLAPNDEEMAVQIDPHNPEYYWIYYAPTPDVQRAVSPQGIQGQFVVQYNVLREPDIGDVLIENGFFAHYFAPNGLQPFGRSVSFVLDISECLMGTTLDLSKEALTSMLNLLNPEDHFAITIYSNNVIQWPKRGYVVATKRNIQEAKQLTEDIASNPIGQDHGGRLLDIIQNLVTQNQSLESDRCPMIIFITDGLALSHADTKLSQIMSDIKSKPIMPLYIIALGYQFNFDLIGGFAIATGGALHRIELSSAASDQLEDVCMDIMTPMVLCDVSFSYQHDITLNQSLLRPRTHTLFAGKELIISGKLKTNMTSMNIEVTGRSALGHSSYREVVKLTDNARGVENTAERLWHFRFLLRLLESLHSYGDLQDRNATQRQAVELSIQKNFVSPVVTMVIEQHQGDSQRIVSRQPAAADMPALEGSFVDNGNHVVVRVPGITLSLCYDLGGLNDTIYQLIYDKATDIAVHGRMISTSARRHTKKSRVLGEVMLRNGAQSICITATHITIDDVTTTWSDHKAVHTHQLSISTLGDDRKDIVLNGNVMFRVLRHQNNALAKRSAPYLGLYVIDCRGLSKATRGNIGQFANLEGIRFEIQEPEDGMDRLSASFGLVKSSVRHPGERTQRIARAYLRMRRNMNTNSRVHCWHVGNKGRDILAKPLSNYVVSNRDV